MLPSLCKLVSLPYARLCEFVSIAAPALPGLRQLVFRGFRQGGSFDRPSAKCYKSELCVWPSVALVGGVPAVSPEG